MIYERYFNKCNAVNHTSSIRAIESVVIAVSFHVCVRVFSNFIVYL